MLGFGLCLDLTPSILCPWVYAWQKVGSKEGVMEKKTTRGQSRAVTKHLSSRALPFHIFGPAC